MTETPLPPAADEHAPPRTRIRVRDQLRQKLPEILLEAGSVVFAILLAFAADEWREDRERRAMAARARATILRELRANRDELAGIHRDNQKSVEDVRRQLVELRRSESKSIGVHMMLAQLSGAAFQAAQSTQAIQFVDFDWLVDVGRVYELQRTYGVAQNAAMDEVSTAGGAVGSGQTPIAVLERVNSRMSAAQQLAEGLLKGYAEVLGK